MEKEILEALKKVIDPEVGVDIVSMNMIKGVKIERGNVKIKFTPTTPFCPMIGYFVEKIKEAVKPVEGVKNVDVEIVF